jgi:hypothetical protein
MSWQSSIVPGYGPHNKSILSVVAKRTYRIHQGGVEIADEQLPLETGEIPADLANPLYSELIAESDLIAYKPKTDIVVLAHACAPRGQSALQIDCQVTVGPASKRVRVYGERTVESRRMRGLSFSEPLPFKQQPIGYVHAYGGRATAKDGTLYAFPPNPLGVGFYLKGGIEEVESIKVPTCEDPDDPVSADRLVVDKFDNWVEAPQPASFGWSRQSFYPRYTFMGIIPEMLSAATDANYAIDPNVPCMDARFYQGASQGLCNHNLLGNEAVKLTHLDADHPVFSFQLPGDVPHLSLRLGAQTHTLEPQLQTVVIDKPQAVLTMLWRGCIEIEGVATLQKIGVVKHRVE